KYLFFYKLFSFFKTETLIEFTNFKCTTYDKKFGEYEYCYIKSINRSYKYISGKFNVYQLPVTKIKVNLALWKRLTGYKPFLYNITFETCAFLRNPKSNPVANFIYGTIREYTNLNHSCPLFVSALNLFLFFILVRVTFFKHGVTLEKLSTDFVNHRFTRVLPFPPGEYLIKVHWLIGNFLTASAEVYGTLS
ncbi:hypothetical protein KR200_005821, partial [Drosophila serrata]